MRQEAIHTPALIDIRAKFLQAKFAAAFSCFRRLRKLKGIINQSFISILGRIVGNYLFFVTLPRLARAKDPKFRSS
jgi:hypothetical protein